MSLEEIGARLAGTAAEADTAGAAGAEAAGAPVAAPGQAWFHQPLLGGYELHVAAGRRPLSARALAALAGRLRDILEDEDDGGNG